METNIKMLIGVIVIILVSAMAIDGIRNVSYGSEYQIDDSNNLFYDYTDHRLSPVSIPANPWSWGSSKTAETELAEIDAVYKTTWVASYMNEYHTAGQLFEFEINPEAVVGSVDFTGSSAVSGTNITRVFFIWNNITQVYDTVGTLTGSQANYTFSITQTQIQNGITDSDNTIYFGINAINGHAEGGIVISSDYIMIGEGISTWNETWVNIIVVTLLGLIILSSVLVKTGIIKK